MNILNRRNAKKVGSKSYDNPVVNSNSTEFEVNNWIISEFVVNELVPVVGMHPFPLSELMLMTAATTKFRPTHIFDWGTHIGKSARVFYEATEKFGIKAKLYSIDLPDEIEHGEHPHEQRGKLVRGLPRVKLIQGDGLKDSLNVLIKLDKKKTIPLFFIDGDHSYESVKREFGGLIKAWPNGIYLLHDTFYQSKDSGYNIGPYQAIKDVLKNTKDTYKIASTNTGLPGMTLVYRPSK
jgi:cephalosporin hydroxylase